MAVDLTKLEKKFIDLFANVTQEEFEQWLLTKTKPMAQQTAVEWFFDKLKNHEIQSEHFELYQQAKQMEEEQSKQDYDAGLFDGTMVDVKDRLYKNAEQYYTQTYGK